MGSRINGPAVVACIAALWTLPLSAQVNVTTYHNDNSRTGQNTQETTLSPANVNSREFGRLFTVPVSGSVYAQPLYMANVAIDGGTHNVLYVATQSDTVYAIDADSGIIYWQTTLLPTGATTVSSTDLGCKDIPTQVGITGTPVIDPSTGTLYVVAKFKSGGAFYQYLHALNIKTGAEALGGPVNIAATAPGSAPDGNGTTLTFSARKQNQRPALLLTQGHVIIAWSSHCDQGPWHGWVISYSAATLQQEAVYNVSPNGTAGGIWMSGSGPAADANGNIYFATGNGSWNATDRGNSIVKLGPPANGSLPLLDYFTPYNQAYLTAGDSDLSAGGLILLPPLANGTQLVTMIDKIGRLYLANTNNLGRYCPNLTPACTASDTNIVEEVPNLFSGLWGTPAYWNGNIYWGGGNDRTGEEEPLRSFSFNAGGSGLVSKTATSQSALSFNFSGPIPSISANGNANGILWALDNSQWASNCSGTVNCQILYAYDATNLGSMLYNSNQAAANRDVPGSAVKFTTPTVANGKVYVGSAGSVSAYGLLANATPSAITPTITPGSTVSASPVTVTLADATPNSTLYYTTNGTTPTTASTRYPAGGFTLSSSATVEAIAVAPGYAQSPVATATYTITTGSTGTPVNLASVFNVDAIANSGSAVLNGGLDTLGYAYAETLLGRTVSWAGVNFSFGAAGGANAVSAATLTLPAGKFTTLSLLATGVRGDHPNQTFIVTYTDGTTSTLTQGLSDWYTPANYPGESKAVVMPYRLEPNGALDQRTFNLYGYSFAINGAKTVKSLTLPNNRGVVVLAATLSGSAAPTPPPPPASGPTTVNLSSSATVTGLYNDGTAFTGGGLDGRGYAYSKTLLGASLTWSGTAFTVGAAGIADVATSVTVPLPAGTFSHVELLATGVDGNQVNQPFTVTYSDQSTTVDYQSLSDWFTPQSYAGESTAYALPYRLTSAGATDNRTFHLYGYSLPINNAKTVASLTLPANRHVVVVAVTLIP